VSPAANVILFSGTVGQLQNAFSTQIHSLLVNGETHVANVTEPQLPRALAPAVKGIVGMDDFHPKSNSHLGPTAKWNAETKKIESDFTLFSSSGTPYLYVDPADAAIIYNTPNANLNTNYHGTTYDSTGVTVGIIGDSNFDPQPLINFRTAFLGETTSTVNMPTTVIDGIDPGINGDEEETLLDLETFGGLAPKAKINYYASDDSDLSAGLFNAMERALNDNAISIMSISFGECEALIGTSTTQYLGELYAQAAAQGITVTVSSGDAGAAGCDSSGATTATHGLGINALASSPYNISVGGTDYVALASSFATYASTSSSGNPPYYATALRYIPERPWNDSTSVNGALANNKALLIGSGTTDIIGGGGGKSIVWTKPAYQSALTPADGARDIPDVSLLAANGLYGAVWVLCLPDLIYGPNCANTNGVFTSSSRFSGAGGTSASTPAFAGMLALVEQATGSRLGQANNVIYKLAATKYSTVFHDVTAGNNSVVCTAGTSNCGSNGFTTGYDAVTGYDLASGLGSVDASAMLSNWTSAVGSSSTTALTINGSSAPLTVTHGANLSFNVAVTPTTATGLAGLITTETAVAGQPTLNGQPFTIPVTAGAGTANYNGLQASLQRRFSKKLTFGAVYTWSKSLTTESNDNGYVDPFNPRLYNYQVASWDRRNVAAINYVWELPSFSKHFGGPHWLALLTDGYELSGLSNFMTGTPNWTAIWVQGNLFDGGRQWSKVAPINLSLDANGKPILPALGHPDKGTPDRLRSGGMNTSDVSLFKNFPLPGKVERSIQLRCETYNIFNHANFASKDYGANVTLPSYNSTTNTYTPESISLDAGFGQPTGVYNQTGPGGPRVIQLAARISF